MDRYYRIVQASATKYRIQYLEERTETTGWLWWRTSRVVREWEYVLFLDKNQSTVVGGHLLPGRWVPMNFNSIADAERYLVELRTPYPLVVKDPA